MSHRPTSNGSMRRCDLAMFLETNDGVSSSRRVAPPLRMSRASTPVTTSAPACPSPRAFAVGLDQSARCVRRGARRHVDQMQQARSICQVRPTPAGSSARSRRLWFLNLPRGARAAGVPGGSPSLGAVEQRPRERTRGERCLRPGVQEASAHVRERDRGPRRRSSSRGGRPPSRTRSCRCRRAA